MTTTTTTTADAMRRARDEGNSIADAENVVAQHKKTLAIQQARDKEKNRASVVTLGRLEAHVARIAALRKARAGQPIMEAAFTGATTREILAREGLFDATIEIRDDIADAFPADTSVGGVRRLYGYADRVERSSTGALLDIAQRFCNTATDVTLMSKVGPAGVTVARLDSLQSLHTALAKANAEQDAQRTERVATTAEKDRLVRELVKETAELRVIGKRAFRKDPTTSARFDSIVPKHAVTKRVAKSGQSTGDTPPETSAPGVKQVSLATTRAKAKSKKTKGAYTKRRERAVRAANATPTKAPAAKKKASKSPATKKKASKRGANAKPVSVPARPSARRKHK